MQACTNSYAKGIETAEIRGHQKTRVSISSSRWCVDVPMVGTRPDITYNVGYLSRSLDSPSEEDVVRVKRVPLHSSQIQVTVATSTTEAEVVAASEAVKEGLWLTRLYQGIVNLKEVPTLQVDNQADVKLAGNPECHRMTKHIEIKHFFIPKNVMEGKLHVEQVSTERQLADIMTKPLTKLRLLILCQHIGLILSVQY
ncbi:hypothetical protein AVEN_8304-1 [Araneus ventricosus]|uniref:Copia protein n=1 Tax=Araneus ventricosus TaxID=182803 RepID=A0A4Y2T654_ARAVE|nr:hypothetical protein AVEN_8304-1 [Araneus ventricosus]